jgi:hypothetical protein
MSHMKKGTVVIDKLYIYEVVSFWMKDWSFNIFANGTVTLRSFRVHIKAYQSEHVCKLAFSIASFRPNGFRPPAFVTNLIPRSVISCINGFHYSVHQSHNKAKTVWYQESHKFGNETAFASAWTMRNMDSITSCNTKPPSCFSDRCFFFAKIPKAVQRKAQNRCATINSYYHIYHVTELPICNLRQRARTSDLWLYIK